MLIVLTDDYMHMLPFDPIVYGRMRSDSISSLVFAVNIGSRSWSKPIYKTCAVRELVLYLYLQSEEPVNLTAQRADLEKLYPYYPNSYQRG